LPIAAQKLIQSRWPWLAASLFLTVTLFVSTTLGWLWYSDQRATAARQLSLDLLWLEQIVTESLGENEHMLTNWSRDLQAPTPHAVNDFLALSDGLMKIRPALIAIDYLDKDGHRVGGLPNYAERPDRPDHLPPVSDPLITEAIQLAYTTKHPVYSKVIEQYAPLWVLVIPIADEGAGQGAILATYDLDKLLSAQVPWWFVQRYDVVLLDRDNKQLSPRDGSMPPIGDDAHRLDFGPEGSGLSLRAGPHAGRHADRLLLLLAAAVVLFGILIIWLLRLLQRWLRERQAAHMELQREREALAASREQLYAVLSGLEAAVSVSAINDGRLLFRNRHHADLFSLEADGECCLPCWPGLPHGSDMKAMEFFDRINSRWYHLERRTILWVDSAPVTLDIATDITAERDADNTARERDELLQHTARLASLAEFASGIAHELNQPLAAIANYSAAADCFLEPDNRQIGKAQEAIRRMGEESRRAGRIIQSMRSVIQKRAIEHAVHDIALLLDEPLKMLAPLALRLQTQIAVCRPAQPAMIECDAVMIEQVLFNLLRNALESVSTRYDIAPADAVDVAIKTDADNVTVIVSDRGAGIVEPDKLFQPFYTTKSGGMGLGLAICRTVIESHGGRLWAENNQDGGARFSFRLPRVVDITHTVHTMHTIVDVEERSTIMQE
jgi:signal transduction histidine kinase